MVVLNLLEEHPIQTTKKTVKNPRKLTHSMNQTKMEIMITDKDMINMDSTKTKHFRVLFTMIISLTRSF